MGLVLNLDIDQLIKRLLCWYAFFIPLEQILDVLFKIDTIFKPYRIFAILIILLFFIRAKIKWTRNREFQQDIFLYLIFIYGILVSFFRMITTPFNTGLFYNDIFQFGLYIGIFVVIRHINFTRPELHRVIKFLALGVIVNALFVFNSFVFLREYRRDGGFMDNPNYLALSLLVIIIYLILQIPTLKSLTVKLLTLGLILFLGYVFTLAGSRTALAVLGICLILILFYSPLRDKSVLLMIGLTLTIIISIGGLSTVENSGPMFLVNRIQKESSSDNRIPIWKGVIKGAETANFLGLGIGQFKARFREFYKEENNDLVKRILSKDYFLVTHSDYLLLIAVYGAFGLVSYLVFLYLSLREIHWKFKRSINIELKQHYQFSFLIFIALALFGLTHENFTSALFWILVCITTRIHFNQEETEEIVVENL
jgi:O-antigen ligase